MLEQALRLHEAPRSGFLRGFRFRVVWGFGFRNLGLFRGSGFGCIGASGLGL